MHNISQSSFREIRLATGLKHNQIAGALNVNPISVYQWDGGGRPGQWQYIRGLASLFGIDEAEAVNLFWHERVSDPCPCGCGGKKVLPDYDKAKHLYVETSCEKCGKTRIHSQEQGHFRLCRRCSYDSRAFGSVKLTCVGYTSYGARVPKFARTCPRHTEKKRKTLKEYKRKTDDGQHAFIDDTRGVYRCKGCAGALFLLRKLERDVKQFWTRANPKKNVPKIQSLEQLYELRRACSKLSYKDDSGAIVTFDPHAFKPGKPKRKPARPRENSIAQATGLLVKNSERANVVKGLCQFCGKLVFSNHEGRAAKVHMKCYQSQQGFKKGIPPEPLRRGRPVQLENLRKHYSWAIRHKLGGESLGDIAKEFGVAKESVVNGIEFILARLPDPDLVNKMFRDRISRLLAPETI